MSNPLPPLWKSGEDNSAPVAEDLAFQDQVMQAQANLAGSMHVPTLEDMLMDAPAANAQDDTTVTPAHTVEADPPPEEPRDEATDALQEPESAPEAEAEPQPAEAPEEPAMENGQLEELTSLNAQLRDENLRLKQQLEKALSATRVDASRGDESERYRSMLDKARERLGQAEKELDMSRAREQDYENLLEEKSEQIRQLHLRLQNAPAPGSGAGTPSEEELRQLFAELQRERQILEEDKLAMEEQYKQMELSMSRERAELGRQRAEVKRLQAELEHLKAMICRGDQIALNQLREEFNGKKAAGSSLSRPTPPPMLRPATPPPMPAVDRQAPEAPADADNPKKSLFGRRFFNSK